VLAEPKLSFIVIFIKIFIICLPLKNRNGEFIRDDRGEISKFFFRVLFTEKSQTV
jgi:hypothetical protein